MPCGDFDHEGMIWSDCRGWYRPFATPFIFPLFPILTIGANMPIAAAVLAIIQNAPFLINEATTLYNAIKGDLSTTEIDQIDAALKAAQDADAKATAAADLALDAAAKR